MTSARTSLLGRVVDVLLHPSWCLFFFFFFVILAFPVHLLASLGALGIDHPTQALAYSLADVPAQRSECRTGRFFEGIQCSACNPTHSNPRQTREIVCHAIC